MFSCNVSYPDRCQGFAEVGLLNLGLNVSQDVPLRDFRLAPACPMEKITLQELGDPLLFNVGIRMRVLQRTKF